MAKDRGVIELESGSLPIDWATEETLAKILEALGSETRKAGPAKRAEKKTADETLKANKDILDKITKLLKSSDLGQQKQKDVIEGLKKSQTLSQKTQTKELKDELKKQGATFFESNAITKEMAKQQRKTALEDKQLLRSLVQAGEKAQKSKIGKATGSLAKKATAAINPMADSAGSIAAMGAGFGVVGAGLGAMVGTIQGFVDSTNTAMQTGFSFGDQLIETRVNVADLGMNLQQFSEILAANGDQVRRLGTTGLEAQQNFQTLIRSSLDASKAFGYFGLTGAEAAEELAPIVESLSKAGVGQTDIMSQAQKTFMGLNQEVMGLAKVTGRDRRELLRQTAAIRGDTLFQSLLGSLGEGAMGAADKIAVNFGVFGDNADKFTDLFKNYTTEMATGIPTLTETQRQFLNMYPELAEDMRDLSKQFIDDPEGAASAINERIMSMFTEIDGSQEAMRQQAMAFRASGNDAMADYLEGIIAAGRDGQALKKHSAESLAKNKAATDENVAAQLALQQNMAEVIQSVQAQFLKLFGVENIEDLAKDEVKDELIKKIGLMGDYIVKFRDWVAGWVDYFAVEWLGADEEKMAKMPSMGKVLIALAGLFTLGPVIASVTTGIAAMFAAKAVTAAMVAGASALFGSGAGGGLGGGGEGGKRRAGGRFSGLTKMFKGLFGLSGAALGGAMGLGGKAVGAGKNLLQGGALKSLARRIPALAVLLGGADLYSTYNDETLTDAQRKEEMSATGGGMAGGLAGATAGAAIGSVIPGFGTAIGGILGGLLGYYGGSATGRWLGSENDSEPLDPDFKPGESGSTDGYHVPETLNGTVSGVRFGPNGEIITGQDPSNAWRFDGTNRTPMVTAGAPNSTAPLSAPGQPDSISPSATLPIQQTQSEAEQSRLMAEIRDYLRSIDRKSGDIVENTQ